MVGTEYCIDLVIVVANDHYAGIPIVLLGFDSCNKAGTTTLWKTLKGKSVKTEDGRDLGKIKQVSESYYYSKRGRYAKRNFGFLNMLQMLLMAKPYGY